MADENVTEGKEPLSIYAVIPIVLEQIAEVSWQKLGLHPDIITGKIHQDLAEAKVAIDLVAYLSNLIEGQLDEEDRRRLQGIVRDLRINFVQKTKEVSG